MYNYQPLNTEFFERFRTHKPIERKTLRPSKIQKEKNMDIKIIDAIQQPNKMFKIKQYLYDTKINKELSSVPSMPTAKFVRQPASNVKNSQIKHLHSQEDKENDNLDDLEVETATVKVESVGISAADQPIPDYSSFFTQEGGITLENEATLILEPHSKALSGNDGVSISTPLSRALLRRGTAVKLLFRPESVAISGAGGTSHAQADLILDFIEEQ